MTLRQIALTGDSLLEGYAYNVATKLGGKGSIYDFVGEALGNLAGIGPLLGPGWRPAGDSIIASNFEWTFTGTWATSTLSDAWDKAPHGLAYSSTDTAAIATWTKPTHASYRPVVMFCPVWIDRTGGGNWQYSIDGGTWTAMGQTIAGTNGLKKFCVPTAVSTTVRFRPPQAGGGSCTLAGIEPMWVDYRDPTTQGIVVHNLAIGGRQLHNFVLASSGDRLAWFDSVTVAANTPAHTPSLVVGEHANDLIIITDDTIWKTDLDTLYDRIHAAGITFAWMNIHELNAATPNQILYRNGTKTVAAADSFTVLDWYDQWANNGWAGWAAANTAGFMADGTHHTQEGATDLSQRVYWFVRNLMGIGNVPTAYTVKAKTSSVAYKGKVSSVAYSAALPVSV